MKETLIQFLTSDAGTALKGLLLVAFLDFATGTFASLRDGTFAIDALAAFVRKHILGRVAPIALLLTVGYFAGDAGQAFMLGAIASAAAYVAETVGSVWGNLRPPKASDEIRAAETADGFTTLTAAVEPVNPVPAD